VLEVSDDGVGVPEGWTWTNANLGLRIASTLVESEISGSLDVQRREGGGTICRVAVPLPR
jgi:two-component system, sensor histidine kinase PdtaS